eukprot:2282028-Amphidinium_carterae.6
MDNRWIQYEPNPRHVQIALVDLGLDKCKPVTTPGSNAKEGESEELLSRVDSHRFRSICMKLPFL